MNTHSHPPNDAPDASVSTVTTNSTPRSIKKTHVAKSKKHRKAVTAASTSARCNWKLRSYSKSKLKFPDYSFMAANTFLILSQGLKYEKFADDVQKANTLFVGQSQMDGLWRKRIRREFARWECVKGVEEWAMLGEALKQVCLRISMLYF